MEALLPREIVHRPSWLAHAGRPLAALRAAAAARGGSLGEGELCPELFERRELLRLVESHADGRADHTRQSSACSRSRSGTAAPSPRARTASKRAWRGEDPLRRRPIPRSPLDNGGSCFVSYTLSSFFRSARRLRSSRSIASPRWGAAVPGRTGGGGAARALSAVHVVTPPQARKRVRQLTSLATRRSYTEGVPRTPALVNAARTGMERFEPNLRGLRIAVLRLCAPEQVGRRGDVGGLAAERRGAFRGAPRPRQAGEWLRRALSRRRPFLWASFSGAISPRSTTGRRVRHRARALRVTGRRVPAHRADGSRRCLGPPQAPEAGESLRLLLVQLATTSPTPPAWSGSSTRSRPGCASACAPGSWSSGQAGAGPEYGRELHRPRGRPGPRVQRGRRRTGSSPRGAGSRLKVVEALARGVPLVSTTLGVEGYDLHDGEHAWIHQSSPSASPSASPFFFQPSQRLATRRLAGGRGLRLRARVFWPRIGERLAATSSEKRALG